MRTIVMNSGKFEVLTGIDACLLTCEQVMKTLRGECIHFLQRGMPYDKIVWNGNPNQIQFKRIATDMLLAVDGVDAINSFSVSIVDDELQYNVTIVTEFGVGTITNG